MTSHEYESEKETPLQISSKIISNLSNVSRSKDTLELTDLVNDTTLAKPNIISVLMPVIDNYGNMAESSKAEPKKEELEYQIKLLGAPKKQYLYGINDGHDPVKTETLTMILMILSVVIIAILLHLVINTVEKNANADDITVYRITADRVNADPLLGKFRPLPIF